MTLNRIVCVVLLLTFSVAANAGDRKFIVKPRSGDRKALPFSEGVLVGNTLYIAGHIGLDAKTDLPPASAEDEARLVMEGIKTNGGIGRDVHGRRRLDADFLYRFEALRHIQCGLQDLFSRRLSGAGVHRHRQTTSQRPLRSAWDRNQTITVTHRYSFFIRLQEGDCDRCIGHAKGGHSSQEVRPCPAGDYRTRRPLPDGVWSRRSFPAWPRRSSISN